MSDVPASSSTFPVDAGRGELDPVGGLFPGTVNCKPILITDDPPASPPWPREADTLQVTLGTAFTIQNMDGATIEGFFFMPLRRGCVMS